MRNGRRKNGGNGHAGNGGIPGVVRCGIYCRKSVDEINGNGAFNSTDAQREACLNTIAAQKEQGWIPHDEIFVDVACSGGTLERPALQRLLETVRARSVQCVIVYRADRLSRRILDFLQLVELFDQHGVAFVSVCEQFNTSTPGGRLYQHMLLSFAQYERELIAERTRHKIHAARRKGKFTGGGLVLGYDLAPGGGRLIINPTEANQVQHIFRTFIERQSLIETVQELGKRKLTLKCWTTKAGRTFGGGIIDRYSLRRILTNWTYRGKVNFDGAVYEGENEPIVSSEDWDLVQDLLRENGGGRPQRRSSRSPYLLAGLLRCEPCDSSMTPCYSQRGAKRYGYYRCSRSYKRGAASCPSRSIPAREVEKFVVEKLKVIGQDPELIAATVEQAREQLATRRRELEIQTRDTQKALDAAHVAARARIAAAGDGRRSFGPDSAPEVNVVGLEDRLGALHEEQAALHGRRIQRDDLEAALDAFDPIFDSLTSAEKQRLVRLLIQEISYNGETQKLAITFSPEGVRMLAAESVASPEATR